jgi:hypothetical protein
VGGQGSEQPETVTQYTGWRPGWQAARAVCAAPSSGLALVGTQVCVVRRAVAGIAMCDERHGGAGLLGCATAATAHLLRYPVPGV